MSEEHLHIKPADATSIPDYILCDNSLSAAACRMAGHILRHQKNNDPPPTREQLAQEMDVDSRSVARWIKELREHHILESERDSRHNVYSFRKPKGRRIQDKKITDKKISDRTITDPSITDRTITDPSITDRTITHAKSTASGRHISPGRPVSRKRAPGGGGGHDSETKEPPPTTPAKHKVLPEEIATETGRWMVQKGFGLDRAYKCQHLPLADCQADFQRRWETLGQRHGAIGDAWIAAGVPEAPLTLLAEPPPDPEAIQRNATYRDAHWRASALLGPGAAYQDMTILVNALASGATDEQALFELAAERQALP